MKLAPAIKQAMKQAQETFSKVDTKSMQNKFQQAVQFMKKKIQDIKKSTQNNEIAIKVNNKDAQKQITQIQKQIDSLQEKINARQMKLNIINPQIDKIVDDTRKRITPDGIDPNNKAMDATVNNTLSKNKDFTSLNNQAQKLYTEIEMYNKQLSEAKSKMAQLGKEAKQTGASQGKMTSFFRAFKEKISKVDAGKLFQAFDGIPKITAKISGHIKNMGSGIKNGIGHVLKYAGALLSLRGIYSILSNSAQSWLSSQNVGAKQLSANIDYMKYAMGSAFAPVIQWVTNLIYNLMKAIQSLVYALFRVNIFANASAKSYASMAGSAKKAKEETKQLAGIHDEINNIQNNDSSNSGNGSGVATPSFDLSGVDSQLSPFAQKLYDFFKPLKESWDNYGEGLIEQVKVTAGQVGGLIASVWGSFENIITNGTVYTSLELILSIIGNIAEAFANAWNYNGNGDAIVQNLANAFNNLLGAINNVVKSEGFQAWLKWCSDKFREMSEKIESINWQPLVDALAKIGKTVGTVALNILSGLVDIFKWLVENPIIAEILLSIAIAIGVVSTVLGILSTIMAVLTPIATALEVSMSALILPILGIVAAIAAVIAIVVLVVANWEWLCDMASQLFAWLGEFFSDLWQGICDGAVSAWNWICEKVQAIWNAIVDFVVGLVTRWIEFQKEKFEFIKNIVVTVFNAIKDFFVGVWNAIVDFVVGIITKWIEFQKAKFEFLKNIVVTAFNAVKDFIVNVWNGIVNTISNVWNTIITKVKEGVSGAWNAITSVFGNISGWFKDKFSQAWQAVKNVFSKGGAIFDGIKDGILNGLKSIVNAIINGINKVIAIPFKGINTALKAIKSVNIMGLQPFSWINTIGIPQIPTLAKGGVLYDDTIVMAGEYSGASTNPEIVTPQNIMEETFDRVMSRYQGNNEDRPIRVQVSVGGKNLVDELIDGINEKTRQTGKAQIKVSYA